MFSTEQVREIYSHTARYYDRAVKAFPLFGVRIGRYRRAAVAALHLQPGATVVELGCGTGLNFPLLYDEVGPHGKIIGVDLTDAMLEQARRRIARHGWQNVELVACDVANYGFPPDLDGVLSTFALTLSPAFDAVIGRAFDALRPGGRLAILDLKRPERWPEWTIRLAAWLNRPFAVSVDLGERKPWQSIRRRTSVSEFQEYCLGAIYLAMGERVRRGSSN